jgi:hypothetical protein
MLSPDDRTLLADLLSPPDGHTLEHAIATTFTLDMTALLTVPLGFAGSDLVANPNHVSLLHAVRQFADRIDVFCQPGMIRVPEKSNALGVFLERVIHPVTSVRAGHLFHPKIWVLRFSPHSESNADGQLFRLICGSRNLTFDRSWDAAIVLEGREQRRRFAVNNPLCQFLDALPGRCSTLDVDRGQRLMETTARLNCVEWDRPTGASEQSDWLRLHVLGQTPSRRIDVTGSRTLVVSPFISGKGLKRFGQSGPPIVVSRAEQLDMLDEVERTWLSGGPNVFTLDDDAAIRDLDDEESGLRWDLFGLHAKVYAFDRGHYTHLMVGSANATDAGWGGNDEILVEIVGKKREFGIDTLIGPDSPFRKLMVEHRFGVAQPDEQDDDLRRRLEQSLREVGSIGFSAVIHGDERAGWRQTVSTEQPLEPSVPGTRITLALATLPGPSSQRQMVGVTEAEWRLDGIEQATPFLVVELECGPVKVSTVVLATLSGGPEDRIDRVLAAQFADKDAFLQFVALLLAIEGGDSAIGVESLLSGGRGTGTWRNESGGLLEPLLQALSRAPAAIDDIGRLVERLRGTEVGREKLPEGWDDLWGSVLGARKTLGVAK